MIVYFQKVILPINKKIIKDLVKFSNLCKNSKKLEIKSYILHSIRRYLSNPKTSSNLDKIISEFILNNLSLPYTNKSIAALLKDDIYDPQNWEHLYNFLSNYLYFQRTLKRTFIYLVFPIFFLFVTFFIKIKLLGSIVSITNFFILSINLLAIFVCYYLFQKTKTKSAKMLETFYDNLILFNPNLLRKKTIPTNDIFHHKKQLRLLGYSFKEILKNEEHYSIADSLKNYKDFKTLTLWLVENEIRELKNKYKYFNNLVFQIMVASLAMSSILIIVEAFLSFKH